MDAMNYSSENQETEQPEGPEHDLAGIGRSYDCVYCKRGFNTAQALGGHMNIHRKDRARNPKPNNLNTTSLFNPNKSTSSLDGHDQSYCHTTLNVPTYYHHQVSTANYPPPAYHPHHASQLSYRTYFPAPTSTPTPFFANHHYYSYNSRDENDDDGGNPQCLNLFGEDWHMSLSLQFGRAHHVEDMEKKGRLGSNYQDDNDVDLELRLGHDR